MSDPDQPEFFVLPLADDYDYWERFIAAGLHQPEQANGDTHHGWVRINLADPAYNEPPEPPAILGLLYNGKRHVISGPPESTKTLVAYILLLETLRAGQTVAIVDFEMGPHAARMMLTDLGATSDELAAIYFYEPDGPPHSGWMQLILAGVRLVLIDASVGAYDASGLDDNARKDVEQWAGLWVRPLWKAGITTLVVDHVTKNADTRGKFMIGSERKLGGADVHLSLDALKALHRGGDSVVKVNVHKDRPGHLPRPTVYLLSLDSAQDSHRIAWNFQKPEPVEHTPEGDWEPTIYMDKVCRYLEQYPEQVFSKNDLVKEVGKRADLVRKAVDILHAQGYLAVSGKRGGYPTFTLVRKFVPSSSQFVPDEPAVSSSDFVPVRPPLSGGRDEVDDHSHAADEPKVVPDQIDVFDPDIQALLDDPEY